MKRIVDKEIDDAIEYFESTYYIVPSHDHEVGATKYSNREAPLFRNVRILKRRHSDYRPGPIKVYTKQEIEEYERDQLK